ncbi:hypothetical protein LCGC14_1932560 [marine sediment metagenome]|uniref:Uncharacterized protein n=1 Tax=marine sediment metagenome TaxID=412755 RepID=A0A0F9GAZ1_9ZZZZ
MSIPEKLAAIRGLLEREGCGDCDAQGYTLGAMNPETEEIQHLPCETCNGTGLNSAYAPLLAVVREECQGWPDHYPCNLKIPGSSECSDCDNTGYTTRSWEGALDGELEGALIKAVSRLLAKMRAGMHFMSEYYKWSAVDDCLTTLLLRRTDDTREAAADALLAALEERGG